MSDLLAKTEVVAAIQAQLDRELAVLETMVASARDEATSAESRPENKYDTRATEASYLAAGQGARLVELRQLVAWAHNLDAHVHHAASAGALVLTATEAGERWVLLAPSGGPKVMASGRAVSMVSTRSPLGRALLGTTAGDDIEVQGPRGRYEVEVRHVA